MPSYLIWSEIQGKTNGPWNIGHNDLQQILGHFQYETESSLHRLMLLFKIDLEIKGKSLDHII